ncbi:hypothetical protein PISMIDRAFT_48515, partial [Pisolithus microcarpus 441]
HCQALHFDGEKLSNSTRQNKKFGMCCLQGQIQLPPWPEPPVELKGLFCGTDNLSNNFRKNIQSFNSAFAFTSLAVDVDQSVTNTSGPYCFKIHGQLHHKMGALEPREGRPHQYAQLYIHDPQAAQEEHEHNHPALDCRIMQIISDVLHCHNPYVALFKHAYELLRAKPPEQQTSIQARIVLQPTDDGRHYNLPNVDEVAAIMPGDGEQHVDEHCEIILQLRGGGLRRVSHLNPTYSPLHYVLLFPCGEQGWHHNIPSEAENGRHGRSNKVTQQCYYAYHL